MTQLAEAALYCYHGYFYREFMAVLESNDCMIVILIIKLERWAET